MKFVVFTATAWQGWERLVVAAVLFYLEAQSRLHGTETCTQRQSEWVMPTFQKNMEYLPVKDIDFSSAKIKKIKLDDAIDSVSNTAVPCSINNLSGNSAKNVSFPSANEMNSLYSSINKSKSKPGILSIIPEFSDKYVPMYSLPEFPRPLSLLYDPNNLKFDYHELLKKCESICVDVSQQMAVAVEKESREQYKSRVWFHYRAGRITASKMKSVCHTNPANPAQSLIKQVCYPPMHTFTSKQTKWGCTHEKAARDYYEKRMKKSHTAFSNTNSGFVINPEWPFIGATPDGVVSCACCGKGVMEIKCPYCHKGQNIEDCIQDKNFCIKKILMVF